VNMRSRPCSSPACLGDAHGILACEAALLLCAPSAHREHVVRGERVTCASLTEALYGEGLRALQSMTRYDEGPASRPFLPGSCSAWPTRTPQQHRPQVRLPPAELHRRANATSAKPPVDVCKCCLAESEHDLNTTIDFSSQMVYITSYQHNHSHSVS
jgi:hypothetical protein